MSISLKNSNIKKPQIQTLFVIYIITASVFFIKLLIEPSRFADYFSYVDLTDDYYFFRDENWFLFEPASTSLFIVLKYFFVSTEISVNIAYYLLGIFYVLFISFLSLEFKADWRAVLLCFCVFGALMAFVTIRATPAYFFVALGFIETLRNKNKAFWYFFVAALFHMSAILALIPLIFSLSQNRFASLSWIYTAGKGTLYLIGTVFFLVATLQIFFQEVVFTVVKNVPIMSRYLVYVFSSYEDGVINSPTMPETSIFHFIYLVICSVFVLIFITDRSDICRKSRSYIFISYVIFILLQFSPVTAFRQSIFWMFPAIFVFPWSNYTAGSLGAAPLLISAFVIFLYQISTLFI